MKTLTKNSITLWEVAWRQLIENIEVEVPNTASISKDILFHVSKFLQKMFFQLMFEIIKWIRQLQLRWQTVPNYWCQIGQFFFFWPQQVFLKGYFIFKTEDFIFAWFWQDCLYILLNYRGQVSFKKLKALLWYWLNLLKTGSQL